MLRKANHHECEATYDETTGRLRITHDGQHLMDMDERGYSLTLIMVSSLTISQTTNNNGKPKTKASFIYNGKWYSNMSVTDPDYYLVPNGTRFTNAHLAVSLPDAPIGEDFYYKFVAQIFPQ